MRRVPETMTEVAQAGELKDGVERLYLSPLPSTRTGALYNAFSYPTKISPEAIALFIATHTKPGAVVLDAFGGSGTTGLAALLCDRPTKAMLDMAEQMNAKPQWGPRTAHLYEIGVLGSFISRALCSPPDPVKFALATTELLTRAEGLIGWMYCAKDLQGKNGVIRHVIWSEVLVCPGCSRETVYWDGAVRRDPLALSDTFRCSACGHSCKTENCKRAVETTTDAFGGEMKQRKRLPVRVYGSTGTRNWMRDPVPADKALIEKIADFPLPSTAPNANLEWGDLYRAGYHTGIEKLHHFYTRRNFIAIATLLALVDEFDAEVREALRLMVLSYNSSHSTLMTRVVVKKGQNDFVLTGAQSGVLYISGLPVEKNVLKGMVRKSKALTAAFKVIRGSRSSVEVHHASSEVMSLGDATIDYVFTDPPFGDYIPYAEANQINELWLGTSTDRAREVIVSKAQGKGIDEYQEMMATVFQEVSRVLKPEGHATVVFHSAHANVWRALTEAFLGSGLTVKAASVLDKVQASFKQVVSEVSVKGDALLLLKRTKSDRSTVSTAEQLADAMVHEALGRVDHEIDPQRLYSQFVGRCLELGIEVRIGAKEFYAQVERRISVSG
jgi:16S rRNA G966 N2-methylase RsmD